MDDGPCKQGSEWGASVIEGRGRNVEVPGPSGRKVTNRTSVRMPEELDVGATRECD